MARKVVLAGACRTAIGVMGGTLSKTPAPDLGTVVIKEALKRTGIKPEQVDEVYMGCVIQAGLGQNPARQAAVNAGIPVEVPATTINVLCGSGMHCVNLAAKLIASGDADIIVAGGMENMSMAPYLLYNARFGYRMGAGKMDDALIRDALTDAFGGYHMGITAENIAEDWGLTREQLDEFAAWSQQKAQKAIAEGKFKDEIVPITVHLKKQDVIFDTDEHPNRKSTPEKMAKLRPAFVKDGTVTAGNASGINDGASFVLVASEDAVKKYNLTPLCEIIGIGQGGVDPLTMGLGPTPAIRNALNYAGVKLDDMDLVELNEAFAAQSLGVLHELQEEHGIDLEQFKEKVNVNGGAIALGHPVGASGNRILVSLIYEMIKRDAKMGLASLCIGGGQGCAVIVKRP